MLLLEWGEEEGVKDAYWLNKCFMQNEFFFFFVWFDFDCFIIFWLLSSSISSSSFFFFFFFFLLLLLSSSSSSSSSFSSLCFSLSPYALLASLYTVNDIIVSNMTCTVVLNFWLRLKCSPFAVLLFVPFTESSPSQLLKYPPPPPSCLYLFLSLTYCTAILHLLISGWMKIFRIIIVNTFSCTF